ncbi:MAG: hypothetical protein ACJ788_25965 [Ktedonobacteraceae bacterium]
MRSPYRFGHNIIIVLWAFMLVELICGVSLSGCGSGGSTPTAQVIPTPNNPVVHKPFRAVQVCIAKYPYTRQAMNILSRWLASSVQSSEDGLDAFFNGLTAKGDVSFGTFFSLSIPKIESMPPRPVTANPFDPKLITWHRHVNAIQAQVHQVQTQVNKKLATLVTFSPQWPAPTSSSLEGCMAVSHIRFLNEPQGRRFLILAIPFLPFSLPRDFLKGITVVGIAMYAPSVVPADYTSYCARLLSASAAGCHLYDASLSDNLSSPL